MPRITNAQFALVPGDIVEFRGDCGNRRIARIAAAPWHSIGGGWRLLVHQDDEQEPTTEVPLSRCRPVKPVPARSGSRKGNG